MRLGVTMCLRTIPNRHCAISAPCTKTEEGINLTGNDFGSYLCPEIKKNTRSPHSIRSGDAVTAEKRQCFNPFDSETFIGLLQQELTLKLYICMTRPSISPVSRGCGLSSIRDKSSISIRRWENVPSAAHSSLSSQKEELIGLKTLPVLVGRVNFCCCCLFWGHTLQCSGFWDHMEN